ncbi:hypothetical protein LTR36_009386 [Oleoguttula mirabilis]|uniref:NmrA-like domain-containing protein n=1 Tax=Oleoguttula mirabilis TaxID=1507867 RepID=A0AAV9JTY7_9PEZI|nr:hypothetical protein LTR36_009386 [Oleoguttula mirabilis]
MAKLLVIIGVTGLQGGSVARLYQNLYQKEPGRRIRGITRDPTKPSNAALREAGIELVAADLDDPSSLDRAFEGANAIFAVTDFWQFLQQPATFAEAEKTGRLPNQVAMDHEIQQGRNIIDMAAKHLAGLDRLVLSTLSDSQKWSNGEIRWNLHFDGKAKITDYLKTTYPDLAAKSSYVQMGNYLSNWRMLPIFAPQKQADGSFIFYALAKPNGKAIPYVDPPNDTGYFVKALIDAPAGITLLGYGEAMQAEEHVALWGKVNGVRARFEQLTAEVAREAGLPEFLVLEVTESGMYSSSYGWDGGDPEVKHPKDVGVDVGKLTKVEDYFRKEDWSGVL